MRNAGFKVKISKIVSLLIVLLSVGLSGNLIAGERRGAMLVVQKMDGSQEEGELIAVRQNSILLLVSYLETDVSINVPDIKSIKIIKESRAWSGLGTGFLIGGGLGIGIGLASGNDTTGFFRLSAGGKALLLGCFLGIAGGVIGLIDGALEGIDATFQIEGKSDYSVRAILKDLRPKARIPDSQ